MKVLKGIMLTAVLLIAVKSYGQDKEIIEKRFKWINKDKNDHLSKEEWTAYYKDKKNKKGEPVPYELAFLGTDKDKDGNITLEELHKGPNWKFAKERKKELEQ